MNERPLAHEAFEFHVIKKAIVRDYGILALLCLEF